MLIVPELWRDLDPRPIGVIRNPVAVQGPWSAAAASASAIRSFPAARWEELWTIYNRGLLRELEAESFPVIDFDRHSELDRQIRSALAFHGREAGGVDFFDRGWWENEVDEWRSEVEFAEALELWDQLAELARRKPRRA